MSDACVRGGGGGGGRGIRTGRRAAVLCVECVCQCVSPGAELGPACLLVEPGWTFFPRLLVVPQTMLAWTGSTASLFASVCSVEMNVTLGASPESRVEDARHLNTIVRRAQRRLKGRPRSVHKLPFSHLNFVWLTPGARELGFAVEGRDTSVQANATHRGRRRVELPRKSKVA